MLETRHFLNAPVLAVFLAKWAVMGGFVRMVSKSADIPKPHREAVSLPDIITAYLSNKRSNGSAPRSIKRYKECLNHLLLFSQYFYGTSSPNIADITEADFTELMMYLKLQPGKNKTLSISSQVQVIQCVKSVFSFALNEGLIFHNPASDLENIKAPKTLSRNILNEDEVYGLLNSMETETLTGIMFRVLFEVMHSAALRQSEALSIKLTDIDYTNRLIRLEKSKFSMQRTAHLTPRASNALKEWTHHYRNKYLKSSDSNLVFSGRMGNLLPSSKISKAFNERLHYFKSINPSLTHIIPSELSPHLFRRSAATSLFNQGVDIRYVQSFLGHASINSTMKYLYLDESKLSKVIETKHPLAKPSKIYELKRSVQKISA